MTSHTEGPWTFQARPSGSENHKGFRICGPEFFIALEVIPVDQDGKEGEANARLIASAPELLEMVLEMKAELELIAMEEGAEPYNNPQLNEVLAKATGAA